MTVQHEYETTFIVRPEALDDEVTRLRSRFEGIITERGGQLMVFEDWGRRRLAYQIERHDHGRYIYLNYIGSAATPAEIERIVRIEDHLYSIGNIGMVVSALSDFSLVAQVLFEEADDSGKDIIIDGGVPEPAPSAPSPEPAPDEA